VPVNPDFPDEEQMWEEKYADLKMFDETERKRFTDIDFEEATYEYTDILFENEQRIKQAQMDIYEILCRDCDDLEMDQEKDLNIVYLNLTNLFSEIAKLRFRNFKIKSRKLILEQLSKGRKK
jgi:hypothetical protein